MNGVSFFKKRMAKQIVKAKDHMASIDSKNLKAFIGLFIVVAVLLYWTMSSSTSKNEVYEAEDRADVAENDVAAANYRIAKLKKELQAKDKWKKPPYPKPIPVGFVLSDTTKEARIPKDEAKLLKQLKDLKLDVAIKPLSGHVELLAGARRNVLNNSQNTVPVVLWAKDGRKLGEAPAAGSKVITTIGTDLAGKQVELKTLDGQLVQTYTVLPNQRPSIRTNPKTFTRASQMKGNTALEVVISEDERLDEVILMLKGGRFIMLPVNKTTFVIKLDPVLLESPAKWDEFVRSVPDRRGNKVYVRGIIAVDDGANQFNQPFEIALPVAY